MELEKQTSFSFLDIYELQELIEDKEDKTLFGDKNNKKCRFCGRGYPEVTFKMKAHVIPQLLGKHNIVSFFECDSCNGGIFSDYEASLAAYIGVLRTFAEVKGQKGVPTYKDNKTNFRIEFIDGMVTIITKKNETRVEIDEESRQATVRTIKDSYYPIRVYKSLAKIAYCLLSQEELNSFKIVHGLLMSNEHDEEFRGFPFIRLFWYFHNGGVNFKKPSAMLCRRRPDLDNPFFPEKTLVVRFANLLYQIFILSDRDTDLVKLFQPFTCIPVLPPANHIFGQADLSMPDKKIGEEHSYTFSFESKNKV